MDWLGAIAALALLAGNAFFVAVEFTVTRARPTMVERLLEEEVSGAKSLKHAVDNIDNYLSACQLGITVCSIGLGIFGKPVVQKPLEAVLPEGTWVGVSAAVLAFALAYGLVSMLHVVLGELAPKSLAIARTRQAGLVLLPPMRIFYLATKPIVDLFNWMGNLVLRPFGIPPASESGHAPHEEAELKALIAESEREGILDPEERRFAEGVFAFGDRRAREVMVPRKDVVYLTEELSFAEAARCAVESGHSRLPVCRVSLDDPVGFVHVRDLLRAVLDDLEEGSLDDLARPLLELPEATLLDDALEEMRRERQQLALVLDEHQTVTGLLALEDVLEEIVGDIRDEVDPERDDVWRREDGRLLASGDAPLKTALAALEVRAEDASQATLGGWLVETLGHVPKGDEIVEEDGWRFRGLRAEGAQVTLVSAERLGASEAEHEGGEDEP